MRDGRRGATLIEALVCAVLFGVLLSATFAVLILGLRSYRTHLAMADLERDASTALGRAAAEVAESGASTVRVDAAPPGIVFASPRDAEGTVRLDADGHMLWQKWVCVYVDGARLLRKERPLDAPQTVEPSPTSCESTQSFQESGEAAHMLAAGIVDLQASGIRPLRLALTGELKPLGRSNRIRVQTAVAPRN